MPDQAARRRAAERLKLLAGPMRPAMTGLRLVVRRALVFARRAVVLGADLRAVVRRAVFLRATGLREVLRAVARVVVLRAVDLRAVVRLAVDLRAVLRAAGLRPAVRVAVLRAVGRVVDLRAVERLVVVLRAAVLRAAGLAVDLRAVVFGADLRAVVDFLAVVRLAAGLAAEVLVVFLAELLRAAGLVVFLAAVLRAAGLAVDLRAVFFGALLRALGLRPEVLAVRLVVRLVVVRRVDLRVPVEAMDSLLASRTKNVSRAVCAPGGWHKPEDPGNDSAPASPGATEEVHVRVRPRFRTANRPHKRSACVFLVLDAVFI